MSAATASRSGRTSPAGRRRPAARRRRRLTAAVVLACAVAFAVVIVRPLFQRAISQLIMPLQYQSIIRAEARAEHLDAALIAAVIYAETRFDPRSSPTGAEGLMQIEPSTARFLARRSGGTAFITSDLWHPAVNIAYGSYYLRYLMNEYHGVVWLALAAYNAGETNVNAWLSSARATGQPLSIASIPFAETRAYVHKVLSAQRAYRSTYAHQLGY